MKGLMILLITLMLVSIAYAANDIGQIGPLLPYTGPNLPANHQSLDLIADSEGFTVTLTPEDHQAHQVRPIQLGTSGGNIYDSSKFYCCGGTLGALVEDDNGVKYILSNNHVLARLNNGEINEEIIQPGLVDQSPICEMDYNDAVANLSHYIEISFKKRTPNTVDAAIAEVVDGKVNTSGYILGIGEVNASTVEPAVDMEVKKSGRTTGLTYGNITAIDVTATVGYNRECGIGFRKAIFTNQIMLGPASFSGGGDSGSLIVENRTHYPRAVGLLFAGSDTHTLANPIDAVLFELEVSMVGVEEGEKGTLGSSIATSTEGSVVASLMKLPSQANEKAIENAKQVKERHEESLFSIEGVVGMGIGLSETVPDKVVIQVYVKKSPSEIRPLIPKDLNGVSVEVIETGEFVAH